LGLFLTIQKKRKIIPRLPRMAKSAITTLYPVFMERNPAPNKTTKVKKTRNFRFFFNRDKWLGRILSWIFLPFSVESDKASKIRIGRTNAKIGCQKNTRTENSRIAIPRKVPMRGASAPGYPAQRTFVIHDSYKPIRTPRR
jgi:hypothetical protein